MPQQETPATTDARAQPSGSQQGLTQATIAEPLQRKQHRRLVEAHTASAEALLAADPSADTRGSQFR